METIEQFIEIERPVRTVYNQWTQFEQFPQFMQGIKSVQQIDDTNMRWTADIAGKDVTWTAKITEQEPDRVVAWQSTSGKTNNGRVRFTSNAADETLIHLELQYEPEGFVENVGDALGVVERRIEGDLQNFKRFIESRGQETGAWRGTVHQGRETSESNS